jgi:hypothetical protein
MTRLTRHMLAESMDDLKKLDRLRSLRCGIIGMRITRLEVTDCRTQIAEVSRVLGTAAVHEVVADAIVSAVVREEARLVDKLNALGIATSEPEPLEAPDV